MRYLLFRLYGPMCSWGDIAVGETRPSFAHPTKSAILGLVAGALGIRRDEEDKLCRLTDALGFAVLMERAGAPLSDYHTAQVPPGKKIHCTRKDEIESMRQDILEGKKIEPTILSTRGYRVDAVYTVALWERKKSEWDLDVIAKALIEPKFVPYLGRKSCPVALPFEPQVVDAALLREALERGRFLNYCELGLKPLGQKMLFWDECDHVGVDHHHIFERRDTPLSRIRWQFDTRKERHAALT